MALKAMGFFCANELLLLVFMCVWEEFPIEIDPTGWLSVAPWPSALLWCPLSALDRLVPSLLRTKMHMSFWLGTTFDSLLFDGYAINTTAGFVMTCVTLASLAVVFEGIQVVRAYLKEKGRNVTDGCVDDGGRCTSETSPLIGHGSGRPHSRKRRLALLLQESVCYLVQDSLGNLVMLAVMTFNGYLVMAACVGGGLGYLVFGPHLMETAFQGGRLHPVCETGRQKKDTADTEQVAGGNNSSIMSEVARDLAGTVGGVGSAGGQRRLSPGPCCSGTAVVDAIHDVE